MTGHDLALRLAEQMGVARVTEGGRETCCAYGPCATHVAEDHPDGGHASTICLPNGIAVFPDTDGQQLAIGATRAAYANGLRVLGLDPDAFL